MRSPTGRRTRPAADRRSAWLVSLGLAAAGVSTPALGQSVTDNAITSAQDAFGSSFNNENVGLYSTSNVRGFSPLEAGNIRLEGLYFDRVAPFSARLVESNLIRVGITAQDYLLPAPSGIVDFHLRPAGPGAALSAVATVNDWGGRQIELDARMPLAERAVAIEAGGALVHQVSAGGARARTSSLAVSPHLRVSKNLSVIGFWNQVTFDGRVDPIFVPGTGRMPVSIEPLEYYGVPWLMQHNVSSHYGALASANLGGGWKARLGLFRSESDTRANHAEVIAGLAEDGTAVRRISKDPPHRIGSTSGEARLWRDLHEGPRLHTLTLSLRGRERISTFGGGTTITLPRAPVRGEQPDEPPFALTAVTRERIRQWTLGLAYQLSWKGLGSLSLGVQRTDYRDRVDIPNAGFNVAHDPIWLPTATVAFAAAKNLVVYGSYTRGIEASGVAPDTAANRTAVLPAKETRQMDAGVRWKSPLGMHVVAGLFSITKPYFAANAQNVYTELGTVEHRGAELSVSGSPLKGLRIIAGAVLLDARVTGSPQRDGRVGRVPFDKPRTTLSFNANYDVAQLPGLSLSVKAVHRSSRYADALDLVRLNPVTIIDTSLRYRIKISGTDAQLRLSVQNIGGAVDWQIVGSGGYQIYTDRQMSCALTINM